MVTNIKNCVLSIILHIRFLLWYYQGVNQFTYKHCHIFCEMYLVCKMGQTLMFLLPLFLSVSLRESRPSVWRPWWGTCTGVSPGRAASPDTEPLPSAVPTLRLPLVKGPCHYLLLLSQRNPRGFSLRWESHYETGGVSCKSEAARCSLPGSRGHQEAGATLPTARLSLWSSRGHVQVAQSGGQQACTCSPARLQLPVFLKRCCLKVWFPFSLSLHVSWESPFVTVTGQHTLNYQDLQDIGCLDNRKGTKPTLQEWEEGSAPPPTHGNRCRIKVKKLKDRFQVKEQVKLQGKKKRPEQNGEK